MVSVKALLCQLLSLSVIVQANPLEVRNNRQRCCDAKCYKAMEYQDRHGHAASQACSSYQRKTVTPCTTVTTTKTFTGCTNTATVTAGIVKRDSEAKGSKHGPARNTPPKCTPKSSCQATGVPSWIKKDCCPEDWTSACSCLGVTKTTVTLPTPTSTSTVTSCHTVTTTTTPCTPTTTTTTQTVTTYTTTTDVAIDTSVPTVTLTATATSTSPAVTTTVTVTAACTNASPARRALQGVKLISTTPAAPSTTPARPTTTPAAPSTTPAAPSTTPAAPSTTPAAPSTTPAAPSTTPAAPSTTPASTTGVSTNGQPTTCPTATVTTTVTATQIESATSTVVTIIPTTVTATQTTVESAPTVTATYTSTPQCTFTTPSTTPSMTTTTSSAPAASSSECNSSQYNYCGQCFCEIDVDGHTAVCGDTIYCANSNCRKDSDCSGYGSGSQCVYAVECGSNACITNSGQCATGNPTKREVTKPEIAKRELEWALRIVR